MATLADLLGRNSLIDILSRSPTVQLAKDTEKFTALPANPLVQNSLLDPIKVLVGPTPLNETKTFTALPANPLGQNSLLDAFKDLIAPSALHETETFTAPSANPLGQYSLLDGFKDLIGPTALPTNPFSPAILADHAEQETETQTSELRLSFQTTETVTDGKTVTHITNNYNIYIGVANGTSIQVGSPEARQQNHVTCRNHG